VVWEHFLATLFANLISLYPFGMQCWQANNLLISTLRFFGIQANQATCEINSTMNHIVTEYWVDGENYFIDATPYFNGIRRPSRSLSNATWMWLDDNNFRCLNEGEENWIRK